MGETIFAQIWNHLSCEKINFQKMQSKIQNFLLLDNSFENLLKMTEIIDFFNTEQQ